ncbi:DUF262 domain-containing protein [Lysinibacillus louembei]|uniref:DUF262 domain-containing protein n=1 Tax=Lysinibacillus louembei TaxID=1470088 RepID=A0ABZ0RTI5_9BACI|nr:DUF262 domain-containing protein [Lysinibacillus louembei]WPK10283.1 DUF262 domain-containing protein [Lysinibacillus louembei]
MVRINSKLRQAVGFNPTKKSHGMEVHEMCRKIKENQITLPLYQRDVSWTLKKAVDLLDYQLFGKAPVAPISINEINIVDTENMVSQISFIDRELISNDKILNKHLSVVDGQQRLTTNFKCYINHPDFVNIVLDVSASKFKIIESSPTNYQIPVGILLNENAQLLENYLTERGLLAKLYPLLINVRSKMHNYNYTINVADDLTEAEQIEWFEILNNAGSRVTKIQMTFSKLKVKDFDIYTEYTLPFKETFKSFGVEELFSPFTTNVSYPIAALNPAYEVIVKKRNHNTNYAPIPSDTKEDILIKLDVSKLREIIALTLKSLTLTLEFLDNYDSLNDIDRVDYISYVIGFFTYSGVDSIEELPQSLTNELLNWVTTVNFNNQTNSSRRSIFNDLLSKTDEIYQTN